LKDIVKKLDLEEFIDNFYTYFARKKPLFMEGDSRVHFGFIKELSKYEFKAPPEVGSFEVYLMHLKKFGTLKLYEIYEIVKVVNYFTYLRSVGFEGSLGEWISLVRIPPEIDEVRGFFDEEGELKSEIDEELLSVDSSLQRLKSELKDALRRVLNMQKLASYLADTQVHYLQGEECLLLRGGFNHVLKGSIIGRSSSGFFYVVPESVKKLKDRQKDLNSKKEEIKYRYEKKISSLFTKFLKFLRYIDKEFDRFDHYQARANFAKVKEFDFVLPNSSKDIIIKGFKHPALKEPRAIDIEWRKKLLFITGVNAGGKTMLLKSILSVAFLSKYLVPMKIDSKNSKIGSFKRIIAILDDPQSVKNDISTFAGRMSEFHKLFSVKEALVGVDEIELGTDSEEAAVLFKAILDEVVKKDIKMVITTHHKRLSSMFATHDETELYAALYDEKNRVPTFRFLKGTIGKSYAFETALRYGIPPKIVQNARELYGKEQASLNDLIQKNIELELKLKKELNEVKNDRESIKKEKESLKELKEKAQDEIDKTINSYEMKYKELLKEVKSIAKTSSKEDIHRSLNKIAKIKKEIKPKEVRESEPLQVGDSVKYGNQKGTIKSLKKNEALIECEGITLRVPLSRLKKTTITKKRKRVSTKIRVQKPSVSSVKLDLHGLRAEEAIEKLDKFLSDALVTGYDEVLITHGIGTGKLAYAVKEFLKRYPKIKSFDDAPINMGGYGATLVKL